MTIDITTNSVIPIESIERRVYFIRGVKVMLDADLAELYGISVKVLVQSIKRNIKRFPQDFMFQLTKEEFLILRSQIVTSRWGGRRYLPYVFTEHGVAMLSSVLKSDHAIEVNIYIIRAFIKLRELLASNKDFAVKFRELEREQRIQNQHINKIYSIIERLLKEPSKESVEVLEKSKDQIGFTTKK